MTRLIRLRTLLFAGLIAGTVTVGGAFAQGGGDSTGNTVERTGGATDTTDGERESSEESEDDDDDDDDDDEDDDESEDGTEEGTESDDGSGEGSESSEASSESQTTTESPDPILGSDSSNVAGATGFNTAGNAVSLDDPSPQSAPDDADSSANPPAGNAGAVPPVNSVPGDVRAKGEPDLSSKI